METPSGMTIGNFGAGLATQKGYQAGFVPGYSSITAISISGGYYESGGRIFSLAAGTVHALTSLADGADFHHTYLDVSESSPLVPVFYDETTEPVFSIAKNGWYHPANTEDRLVDVSYSPAASSTIEYFDAIYRGGGLVEKTTIAKSLALNLDPTGDWQAPTTELSVFIPVNAKEALIGMAGSRVNSYPVMIWATNEAVTAGVPFTALVFNYQRFSVATFGTVLYSTWGSLGASRNIKIGGTDNDGNFLGSDVRAYRFGR